MKFGKTFEKALEAEDLPEEWKAAAIKYKSLKVSNVRRIIDWDITDSA